LAEVEFQLGKKDEAIAVQKKAWLWIPSAPTFRKQLKRIEAATPPLTGRRKMTTKSKSLFPKAKTGAASPQR